jgi:hypothetical protein
MHTFIKDGNGDYIVGHLRNNAQHTGDVGFAVDDFVPMIRVRAADPREALRRAMRVIHYLNGGDASAMGLPFEVEQA